MSVGPNTTGVGMIASGESHARAYERKDAKGFRVVSLIARE